MPATGTRDVSEAEIERLLSELAERDGWDVDLPPKMVAAIDAEAAASPLPEFLEQRFLAAVQRGRVDALMASARTRVARAPGAFGVQLRRVREEANVPLALLAWRASVRPRLWEAVESGRQVPETLPAGVLASMLEASQLRVGELEEGMSFAARAASAGSATVSFRTRDRHDAEAKAALADLLIATATPGRGHRADVADETTALVKAVRDELRRRGRTDLL